MKRSSLLMALMMVVAVLAPPAVASAADVASGGGTPTEDDMSSAQLWKAEMIAGYFGEHGSADAALDLVIELRTSEPAMGWGVLSKLAAYAVASDMDFATFLESAVNEDGSYSMGQLRKDYLQGVEDELYAKLPYKNFGQMQQAEKPPKPGKPDKKTPPGQAKKAQG